MAGMRVGFSFSWSHHQFIQIEISKAGIADMNEDILHLIFGHFDGSAQARKDLFSAAQACKAFVEPALDSLWSVLHSLLPLLLLLPSAEIVNNQYVGCKFS
jgi:hypothetical protein